MKLSNNLDINRYLSIGSVVLLKNGQKKLMIIGFDSIDNKDSFKVYDYVGVFYPQGVLSLDKSFAFNHSDIKEVYFNGYTDNEDKEFKSYLNKFEKEYIVNGYLKQEAVKEMEKMNKKEDKNE